MQNLSVLVTGGLGFIGSHIVEYLLNNDVKKIRILDNASTGSFKNIESFMSDRIEIINGDICDYQTCYNSCSGIDVICHQAAICSVVKSVQDPDSCYQINVRGFLNILNSAKQHQIKRVVYASSSAVYGDVENCKQVEYQIGNPLSPYGLSKLVNEQYGSLYSRLYQMECIGLRYFNVYGPRQDGSSDYSAVISCFMTKMEQGIIPHIYGDGKQTRDFVYVKDVARANMLALLTENSNCYGNSINIGSGVQYCINDLYQIIAKQYSNQNIEPKYLPSREGEVLHSCADVKKSIKQLDFHPCYCLEMGIKEIYLFNRSKI